MFTNRILRIFDFLFPKKARNLSVLEWREEFVNARATKSLSGKLLGRSASVHWIFPYKNMHIKPAILDIKRGKVTNRATALVEILFENLFQLAKDSKISKPTSTVDTSHDSPDHENNISKNYENIIKLIIYVPSSAYRLGKKDFDHIEKIISANEEKLKSHFIFCKNAIKIQQKPTTISQHNLKKSERLSQAQEKFILNSEFIKFSLDLTTNHQVHIYCIDDITTTGSTFEAIANLLAKNLPSVQVTFLAIAH